MPKSRKHYEIEFKSRVALEALKERETINAIASKYEIAPSQVMKWRDEFEADPVKFIENKTKKQLEKARKQEEHEQKLMATIGQLTVEVDFLKKKSREIGIL